MNKLIAIVDDEKDILELICLHLKKRGFAVQKFICGKDLFNFLKSQIPDLIILDLMLPDIDGIDICKYLKQNTSYCSIPVIILTARAEETEKILGLELGADDYITKPFSPAELTARIKAVLRRTQNKLQKHIIKTGPFVIDTEKYTVSAKNKQINLTVTEFKILQLLSQTPGKVYTREKILDYLWGNEKVVIDRTVDVHIKHLREKLGHNGNIIKNVRGIGYKIQNT